MDSSSPLSKICQIKESLKKDRILAKEDSHLHNYEVGFDEHRFLAFVSAEVHKDSLDKGEELQEGVKKFVNADGVVPGDIPFQLISPRLGGWGRICNYLPVNEKLDLTAWAESEEIIYKHVKNGDNKTAIIMIGAEHERPHISRPVRIYHAVQLMENGEKVGQAMEMFYQNDRPPEQIFRPDFLLDEL